MLSFSPISGAPISSTEEASTGPQTYNLVIEEELGFDEYIFDRNPEAFEEIIEESLGVEDLPSVPSKYEEIIEDGFPISEGLTKAYPPVLFTKLSDDSPSPSAGFYINLPYGYSIIVDWGDGSSETFNGEITTINSVEHLYLDGGSHEIKITGNIEEISYFEIRTDKFSASLEKLVGMDGLTAINFQNMQLAGDISVLSELTKLQNVSFYLTGDDITGDMSSLAGLTELSAISFNECTAGLTYTSSSLLWKVNDAERECDFIFVGTRFSQTEVDNLLANLDSLSISIPSLFRRILLTGLNSAPSSASISVIASLEAKGWTVYIYPAAEEILEESFSLDDLSVWATGYSKIINEALRLFDSNGVGFHVQVAESLGVAEQLKEILGILAHDFLNLNPGLFSNWKGSEQASSGISLAETSSFGKLFADTIAEGVGLSDFSSFSFHLLILDSLVCSSSVEAAGLFQRQIMEAMTLTDSALKAWESLIEDVFSIVESASLIYGVMATVEESVSLSGNSAYLLFANEAVNDSFQLQPSIALRSVLGAVVQDSLGIFCQVLIDGEVWECWVLNTNKFHPSIYSGFDFNSYAIFEGMAYGAKVDGIYELTGDLDNGSGIRSGVAFPETDFGTVSEKRFRKAYLGIAGDSPVLKVENENDYGFYGIENDKTTINRSLHGERWAFSILDFDELEFVELVPVILSRRQA